MLQPDLGTTVVIAGMAMLQILLAGIPLGYYFLSLGGGLIAAREIMINNQAVANLVATNKISQLPSVIKTSYHEGMIDVNKSIEVLYQQGWIDEATSKNYQRDLETKATYFNS